MKTKTNMCLRTNKGLDLRYAMYKDYCDQVEYNLYDKGWRNKFINMCMYTAYL